MFQMGLDIYICIFTISLFETIHSYNIDLNSPLIKSIKSPENSSFGFSLSIFSSKNTNITHLLVGSPSVQVDQSKVKTSGAFYSCPLTEKYQDCIQRSISTQSENSLFGYVVDSNSADNAVYTCAPRFLKSLSQVKYVEGNCWKLDEEYNLVDPIPNTDCSEAINANPYNKTLRNCLTGGALTSLGNKEVLVTAPYSYDARGLLINSRYDPQLNSLKSRYLRIESYMSKHQLTGVSMSVGRILRENRVKTVVLGAPGLPQSSHKSVKIGHGQVLFAKLVDGVTTFYGLLSGDTFGSGFGYSVLAMDLNGDGYDELVVGAPFTTNNRGVVFVYWNQEKMERVEGEYLFHLSVNDPVKLTSLNKSDDGQFGNSLENIGDINKDSFMDLAVGCPFENNGRGSIYIYLGSNTRRLNLSQKIDASEISHDFRGFGFSIFGRNSDIDGNEYPDVVVGAAVSGHVIGLRTRPVVRIYADNMLQSSDQILPYSLETLSKCRFENQEVLCVKIKIQMYYHYLHSASCQKNSIPILVNYTIDLDRPYLISSYSKRVHFLGRSNVITDSLLVECKPPSLNLPSSPKEYDIIFQNAVFFNMSQPINIDLKWSMIPFSVPRRKYELEEKLVDLYGYPIQEKGSEGISNTILFGAGCTAETCKPILTFGATSSLEKIRDEYDLNIGSVSSFTIKITVKNTATSPDDRAYNTFIKVDYSAIGIIPTSISTGRHRSTPTGLLYAVASPLEVHRSEDTEFVFSLSSDFIQSAEKYFYLNISLDAMCPQPHLKPILLKIRVRMIANIDMIVSIAHIDLISYHQTPVIGTSGITDEQKIGPRLKLKISLSNKENASTVVSSKLVILFPWEVAGDPMASHGQYLLFLQTLPRFFITGANRNITCDGESLKRLVNPIGTKMFETAKDSSRIQYVSLGNVSVPRKTPKPHSLRDDPLLISNAEDGIVQSDWDTYVLLNCMNGTARCIPIVCDMGPLSKQSGEINLELDFRIWIHTFVENYIRYKFVKTEIPIFWVPDAEYDIVLKRPENSFKLVEIKADNLQKPEAPPSMDIFWAVALATGVGVVFLATIVLILYKCHFFRRKSLAAVRKRQRLSKQL